MTYVLIVPPELLAELVAIRQATGISIRQQIIRATAAWILANRRPPESDSATKSHEEVRP